MKRSNRLVILVGVLLAVLAFVGIVILLNQRPTGSGSGGQPTTVQVMVARANIAIGDPCVADSVEPRQVNSDAVVQTRIPDASMLTGRPALVAITAGQQVTQEACGLVGVGVNNIEDRLEPGEKAVAFQVDRVTGLDFLIQAGDRIDIVIAQEVTPIQQTADSIAEQETNPDAPPRYEAVVGLNNARTVKTIITDRRVLYVSATRVRAQVTGTPSASAQGQPAQAQIENVIIVFAGSDQDAELIKFAQRDLGELGALTAVLRRTEDTEEEVEDPETLGVTLDLLVSEFGVPVPDIIVLATSSPSPRGGGGGGN